MEIESLVIDIGNTIIKYGIFSKGKIEEIDFAENIKSIEKKLSAKLDLRDIKLVALSSVRVDSQETEVKKIFPYARVKVLSSKVQLPFLSHYSTPQTLGADRIANLLAAFYKFQDQHCIIIDLGTCVTYDYLDKKRGYLGGAISPGWEMRLKSMHKFTSKLPKTQTETPTEVIEKSTKTALQSGAFYGLVGEIEGFISAGNDVLGEARVILTGGNASNFESYVKSKTFAIPELTLWGIYYFANEM